MTQLSSSFQATLLSLTLFCSPLLYAETTVENSIKEYVSAAHSGDLNRYQRACELLITTARNSNTEDMFTCSKIAHEIGPRVRKNAASFSYSAGPFALLNTYMHTISKRSDSKECLALSMAASAEALFFTLMALQNVALLGNTDTYHRYDKTVDAVLLSLAATLQWTALYKNNAADKEKNAFDDAYIILIKQLDIIIGRPAKRV
jgi:hypothetical protein